MSVATMVLKLRSITVHAWLAEENSRLVATNLDKKEAVEVIILFDSCCWVKLVVATWSMIATVPCKLSLLPLKFSPERAQEEEATVHSLQTL